MTSLLSIITLTLLAGLAMPIGASIANVKIFNKAWIENEFRHGVIAFGGSALLTAVALVLVHGEIEKLSITSSALFFMLGGFFFMVIDIVLSKIKTSASQLMAMLTDFIPESLALGATFSINQESALLLALLIALQNLPEGFNAFDELKKTSTYSHIKIISLFSLLALLGPIAGVSGYLWLVNYPEVVSEIMLFATGGILYSVFQDIAPQVPLKKHWLPAIGAVFGFMLGIIGFMTTISQ